jgi:hypothetical protein
VSFAISSPQPRLLARVAALPPGRVHDHLAAVWRDLTGHEERHRF